jgi:SAM-dependent methyltransferase
MTATRKDQRRMYGDLARLWPFISSPENYVGEAELFARLIKKYSRIKVRSLLHLGCGGGHLDLTLKKHFRITGVDLSEDMLRLARELNSDVEYVRGDMRTVRLRRAFDAVVIADSITYMTSERDLRRAFVTAFGHLGPGGVFCTYAELTSERFEQNKTDVTTRKRGDTEVVFVENAFDPDSGDTTCEFTFIYIIRRGRKLRVEIDRHVVGLFRKQTWVRLLKDVGFTVKQIECPGEHVPIFVCAKPR